MMSCTVNVSAVKWQTTQLPLKLKIRSQSADKAIRETRPKKKKGGGRNTRKGGKVVH